MGTVFIIRKCTDVAGLHYDFMLGKLSIQFSHLLRGEGHAVVYRGLGLFDDTYFHDF